MDLKVLSIDEMKVLADGFEMKYHPNIGADKLREKLEKYVAENPGCLDGDSTPDPVELSKEATTPAETKPEEKPEEKPPTKEGMVKIKSIHRGEISSSKGIIDFGEDGIVEVKADVAEHFLQLEGYDEC